MSEEKRGASKSSNVGIFSYPKKNWGSLSSGFPGAGSLLTDTRFTSPHVFPGKDQRERATFSFFL